MLSRVMRSGTPVLRSVCLGLFGVMAAQTAGLAQTPWSSAGGDIFNSHSMLSAPGNVSSATQINPSTVSQLKVKWVFTTSGDVSATPTVEPGGLYVPDWGGTLYKINPQTGALIWSHAVCDYTSTCYTATSSISRTAPAIAKNTVVIGDLMAHYDRADYGARVIGVDKATGLKKWVTIVNNSSLYASVLGSPQVYNNIIYVGTASWEEGVAGSNAAYKPVFKGNVTALNADTGAIIWQFTTVPAGYAGVPIPGSSMSIWPQGNSLLIGTGNNYAIPASVSACAVAAPTIAAQTSCLDPTDYVDSLMALNLTTGRVQWARRMYGSDVYTEACYTGNGACPKPRGDDVDFAQAPILTWLPNFVGVHDDRGGSSNSYMMAAGQKNSIFYAVNPANGGLFWSTTIGIGGMEWGSTINTDDHNMFYVALHNPQHVSQTILGRSGTNPHTWASGAWEALDVRTGAIKWQVETQGRDLVNPAVGGIAPGCMTFTNRVLFAGSSSGLFTALDAASGYAYWAYATGGTVVSCPAIFNETVYWGTGYARQGVGMHKLYAFSVNGT